MTTPLGRLKWRSVARRVARAERREEDARRGRRRAARVRENKKRHVHCHQCPFLAAALAHFRASPRATPPHRVFKLYTWLSSETPPRSGESGEKKMPIPS